MGDDAADGERICVGAIDGGPGECRDQKND